MSSSRIYNVRISVDRTVFGVVKKFDMIKSEIPEESALFKYFRPRDLWYLQYRNSSYDFRKTSRARTELGLLLHSDQSGDEGSRN